MTDRDVTSSDEWYTPIELIHSLGAFDLDPACGPLCEANTARRKYGPAEDGLAQEWKGRVWLNPPFSNARPWVEKLVQHGDGVLLVFCRSDAIWFQKTVEIAGGFFMLSGRTQFTRPGLPAGRCPLGCCLIPFGKRNVTAVIEAGLKGTWCQVKKARHAER